MSTQVAANSIDALKDLRVALALYGEETQEALGAVAAEVRRTAMWLHQDRPAYWQEQIKRRRDRVASARAELFRRKIAQAPGSSISTTEQEANLRRAEAELEDAERRLILTRKWQQNFAQVVFEYRGSVARIKGLAAAEVPSGVNLLTRVIDALEAYLRVSPGAGAGASPVGSAPAEFEAVAAKMIDDEPPAVAPASDDADDGGGIDDEEGGPPPG